MCTVSVIRLDRGIRLVTNRDEQRDRAAAKPPEMRRIGSRSVLMPVDPVSDGTWIAVNDAGLVMTLLNVNPPKDAHAGRSYAAEPVSRGIVIPALMTGERLEDVIDSAAGLVTTRMRPFRLVVTDGSLLVDFRSDGDRLHMMSRSSLESPLMFTSSGLGDHLVERPRRELFDRMFVPAAEHDLPRVQEAFHRHVWPDRRAVSVNMDRPDARTVSVTIVTLDDRTARMTYFEGVPAVFEGGAVHELRLAPNLAA